MARSGDGGQRVWVEVKDNHQRILIIEPGRGPSGVAPEPRPTPTPFGKNDA
jgi:hypothetical protein